MTDNAPAVPGFRVGTWWWTALVIIVPVVLLTAIAVVVLLATIDIGDAKDRIELVKTGLAVGAGTGGVVALVLAGRRQWATEQNARATEHDATERRVTELYTKAADQLGSDKAAVRLAGLYALERLAQNSPNQRETILNVICAYLRMSTPEADQEEHVRQTAQRILLRHRLYDPDWWGVPPLDLTGASLTGAKLVRIKLGGADLTKTNLSNANLTDADLAEADLTDADLSGAKLYGADLTDANLHGANLTGADLTDADLTRANLHGADLTGAKLHGADLTGANVTGVTGYPPAI